MEETVKDPAGWLLLPGLLVGKAVFLTTDPHPNVAMQMVLKSYTASKAT
jgi:hypothetical protein